ncbi:MAG: alkaline phosphatase family protein [Candidatus Micrarchaeaceae archaeon]
MKKFYLIGIDSTPLWIINKLVKKYSLSGFQKIINKGTLRELSSTFPPMTGAAWPTIYTGLNPSEHGVPDFFEMKSDYTPDLAFYNAEMNPPFWKDISDRFGKCLVITPAMNTTLPSFKNIDIITGFPLKAKTNSKKLEYLMLKENFTGEPEIEKDMKAGKMSEEEAVKHFVKSIKSRSKIAKTAIEENNYSFVYVCFTETDRLQHFVLNKKNMEEYIFPIYSEIDKFIQFCLDRSVKENSSVMIISDHGAQPITKKFLINSWMIKNNFAILKDSVLKNIINNSVNKNKVPVTYYIREKAMKTGLRKIYDKLPHSTKKIVQKSMGKIFSSSSSGVYTRLHLFDYNMSKTKAFAGISNINMATIFINNKRFENGIIKDSDTQKIKDELKKKLLLLKTSDNKKIIKNIFDANDYYTSKPSFIAPDLFVEAEPGYSIDIFNFSKSTLFMDPEPPKRGDHTQMGILGYYSPNNKVNIDGVTIYGIKKFILNYYKNK